MNIIPSMQQRPEPILEMRGITKRFPGVLALDAVDLSLQRGEILALLGENGAGKSTLMKILSGAYLADEGEIVINSRQMAEYSPLGAIQHGVGIIYQELNYADELSIAENIFLGHLPTSGPFGRVDFTKLYSDSLVIQKKLGIHHDPRTPVSELTIAQKQLIEIARAFSRDVKILVFDEPTSALNEAETESLFALIRSAAAEGIAVIYISHKMDEIYEISHSIQIMRDGKSVTRLATAGASRQEIIRHMVGREIKELYPVADRTIGEKVLEVDHLTTAKARDVSLHVCRSEIVSLFGLMGAGRTDIVKAVYGAVKKRTGEIRVNGKTVEIHSPEEAIRHGIAYVPAERKTEGLALNLSVKENITLAALRLFQKGWRLDHLRESAVATEWVSKLNIRTPSLDKAAGELSGGNQQKIVLAKYLLLEPKVIILNEPTKGIDIGAKQEIYRIMEELCEKGFSVIFISSEMPEVMALADRIIVISNGKITGECKKADGYNQEKLMEYAIAEVE